MAFSVKKTPSYSGTGGLIMKGDGGAMRVTSASNASTPTIVTENLELYLNASDSASYSGTGTTWYDLSGKGNNASLVGSPTYSSTGPKYLDFGDSAGPAHALVNLNSGLRPTGGLTEAGWVKLPSTDNSVRVLTAVQYGTGSDNSFAFFTYNGGWYGAVQTVAGITISPTLGTSTIGLTTSWCYYVHTYDGVRQKIYINGALVHDAHTVGGYDRLDVLYNPNNTKLTIGMNYDGSGYDTGVGGQGIGGVSAVQFYSRALTAAEVLQNYNIDAARHGL
jgi:hypothetical protein